MSDTAQQVFTGGAFPCEQDALDFLDNEVRKSDAFRSYSEVWGSCVQPRCGVDCSRLRIDRILIPQKKLVDAGWCDGPIGVECKKSGHKVGKVLSQALDYSRCAWELPNGFLIMLRWVFIWPLDDPKNDLTSLMAQNRIGYLKSFNRTPLVFGCGGTNGIVVNSDGTVEAKRLPMGGKAGSR